LAKLLVVSAVAGVPVAYGSLLLLLFLLLIIFPHVLMSLLSLTSPDVEVSFAAVDPAVDDVLAAVDHAVDDVLADREAP
jgi:hypothetical protein